jgi:hypothetical protein
LLRIKKKREKGGRERENGRTIKQRKSDEKEKKTWDSNAETKRGLGRTILFEHDDCKTLTCQSITKKSFYPSY